MTAVHLFDALATPDTINRPCQGESIASDLGQLAEKLVAASLDDVRQIQDYERQFVFGAPRRPEADLAVRRSVWEMFAAWVGDAEQVLARARSIAADFPGTDQLDDAIGRVRARLTVSPEQVVKAKEQVRQGQFVPAKELRDELHTRIRA